MIAVTPLGLILIRREVFLMVEKSASELMTETALKTELVTAAIYLWIGRGCFELYSMTSVEADSTQSGKAVDLLKGT
ncbi:hypothetical protein FRC03_004376 [Tulasnella sp. 419]|nr:hypothetical protein FRC03_004376 [Tulasnella sp. 419]